ncbi:hypothetical protein IPA_01330 [Ignicoccus pacificus DSM 13166]|uniref:TNase-like domain-containing protein n=1 Tax=Ignicoccus pacificus DSM 13166 TaxID=940294 RepID=A0A977KCF3_9CREN|nr:hypothetical protein IPA_01330 [Ignicoccus pacificus DSM 13166]
MRELLSLLMTLVVIVNTIIDGDTFWATLGKERFKVRLYAVNAPERGMKCYEEAKDFLRRSINHTVTITPLGKGIYKRIIAVVNNGTSDLNLELIKKGLAIPYPYPPPERRFLEFGKEYVRRVFSLWSVPCIFNGTFKGIDLITFNYNPPGRDEGREYVVLSSNVSTTITVINKRWKSVTATVTPGINTVTLEWNRGGFLGNKGDVIMIVVGGKLAAEAAYAPWAHLTTIKETGK